MSGRHRRRGNRGGLLATAAGVAVALTVGGGFTAYRTLHSGSCDRISLTVAAAPEIAPAVQAAASSWANTGRERGCVAVAVTATDPAAQAAQAAAVAGQQGAELAGLGIPDGWIRVPQVWVPDSSTWLTRLGGGGTGWAPASATSIASSPVVLAVPQPTASALGWADAAVGWQRLLTAMSQGTPVHTGLVDPGQDAASLNSLLTLRQVVAGTGQAGQDTLVAALRALALHRSTVRADLLARFPHGTDPATVAAALSAAPLPEHAVLGYDAAGPPVPLDVLPLTPAPAALDYPYTVMPDLPPAVRAAADRLRAALSGPRFRDQLAAVGLRAADGSTGTGFAGSRATAAPGGGRSDSAAVDQALSTWSTLTRPGRMLAVVDVSGSMLTPVPTAGGATRERVTVQAAAGGLALFDDSWQVGLWMFATDLDGTRPYRQLAPIVSLADHRPQLRAALRQVKADPHGNTALYQTLLAAYQNVQAGWDPTRVNSVVLITDGMNDNPGGMTLAQLTTQLQRIVDPNRPVQVIVLGIGTQVPRAVLLKITQSTGGGVFIATDPAAIGTIFLQAIALRPLGGG